MATENKHTPGPWSIKKTGFGYKIQPNVAFIGEISSISQKEQEANANLITAAPEMLEALEKVIELAWRDHKSEEELVLLEDTDRLINKAKGL